VVQGRPQKQNIGRSIKRRKNKKGKGEEIEDGKDRKSSRNKPKCSDSAGRAEEKSKFTDGPQLLSRQAKEKEIRKTGVQKNRAFYYQSPSLRGRATKGRREGQESNKGHLSAQDKGRCQAKKKKEIRGAPGQIAGQLFSRSVGRFFGEKAKGE